MFPALYTRHNPTTMLAVSRRTLRRQGLSGTTVFTTPEVSGRRFSRCATVSRKNAARRGDVRVGGNFCVSANPCRLSARTAVGALRGSSSPSGRTIHSSIDAVVQERPRRTLFSCPGADERKIAKAQSLGADAVVLDLEDGVAMDRKDDARDLVVATLHDATKDFGDSELCVRVNALADSCDRRTRELALLDLKAILPCPRLEAIVIPKVESAQDVLFVRRLIDMTPECRGRDVRLIAAIESARGMSNLREIVSAAACRSQGESSARLDALVFASEDYCADLEAVRTAHATELLYARSQIVMTAKAYGLQAIDMVHIQYKDLDDLARECHEGRTLGFTGKQAIHPTQISTIHECFSPSTSDVDFASRVIQEYLETTLKGGGATVVDGIVVDAPVYKWAKKIVKRANAAGIDQPSSK